MRPPFSLLCFAAAGILLLPQLVPGVGFLLAFLGIPILTGLAINCGFLALGIEALASQRISRFWLLGPLLWFGGYAVYVAKQHQEIEQKREDIARHNAGVVIPFDPSRTSLVFSPYGMNDVAALVSNYSLPIGYVNEGMRQSTRYRSWRLAPIELCAEIRRDRRLGQLGILAAGLADRARDIAQGPSPQDARFCVLELPEGPPLPVVTIRSRELTLTAWANTIDITSRDITMPDGQHHEVRAGRARRLPWWPSPFIACISATNSQSDCRVEFTGGTTVSLTNSEQDHRNIQGIAQALGLTPIAQADRRADDSEILRARINTIVQQILMADTIRLDRVIAEPAADDPAGPFWRLRDRPEIIVPRLDVLIAATAKALATGTNSNANRNARHMFELLQQTPIDLLAPYMPRIEALSALNPSFTLGANRAR